MFDRYTYEALAAKARGAFSAEDVLDGVFLNAWLRAEYLNAQVIESLEDA